MITQQPDGSGGTTRLIVSSDQRRPLRRLHDKWYDHGRDAVVGNSVGFDGTAPLQTCASASFVLKDGTEWIYLYGGYQGCYGGIATFNLAQFYQVPGLSGFYLGEGFNFVLRRMGCQKLTPAGALALANTVGADASTCGTPP